MNAPILDRLVLETERLTLRPQRKSDAGLISLYTSDFRVAGMTSTIPHPNPPGAVEQFIERSATATDETVWAIDATKGLGCEVVGVMALHKDGELGYWIAPFFWGIGIATEAGQAVVKHAFESRMDQVYATHFVDNPASGRVMQKLGMTCLGPDKEPGFSVARGENVERIRYERLRSDG